MTPNRTIPALVILASLATPAAAEPALAAAQGSEAQPDVVETALDDGRFSTLVTALDAAGLAERLQQEGPFTLLAPTDEAFEALPDARLEALLDDPEELRAVLLRHVVEGEVLSARIAAMDRLRTLGGATLPVSTVRGVTLGDARVLQADVLASNGVLHVLDAVLMP
jgi:uncharacterized surface protein with fasciclin (FAS1) repeats